MKLLTLGHGTLSAPDLSALIRSASIAELVDVRSVPRSRRHPQFWREALERWIPLESAATYRWDRRLGGFRKPDPDSSNVALRHPSFRAYADYMETGAFAEGMAALLEGVASRVTAVMCSETLWWRCHRRLIADSAALSYGVEVLHLMHDGSVRPHIPTAGVRALPDGGLRYDDLFAAQDPDQLPGEIRL